MSLETKLQVILNDKKNINIKNEIISGIKYVYHDKKILILI